MATHANLAVEGPTIGGVTPTFTAATLTDGNKFSNSGKEFVFIKNGGGSPVLVTFPTPATTRGLAIEDKVVTVAAGAEAIIGRFDPGLYNQSGVANTGKLFIEYDQVTSVTVAVFR